MSIERYDAKERIAVVRTPGWTPETKPYQFDGKQWVPLWSPSEAPAVDHSRENERTQNRGLRSTSLTRRPRAPTLGGARGCCGAALRA